MDEERRPDPSERPISGSKELSAEISKKMDEEVPEPVKTGADFYLKKMAEMMAAEDPMLGQSFQADLGNEGTADFSKMTIEEKLKERNHKAKLAGIEELSSKDLQQDDKSKFENEYLPAIFECLASPIPGLQKATLELLKKLYSNHDTQNWFSSTELIRNIFDKIYSNLKPICKRPSYEIITSVYKVIGKEAFLDVCRDYFSTKNSKIRLELLKLFNEMLQNIGIKEFPALKYWDGMWKDCDSASNPQIKKEFFQFSAELHLWIGPSFEQKLKVLKKPNLDETLKAYSEKKSKLETPQPLPILDEYKDAYTSTEQNDETSTTQQQDCYDMFEAVDIFKGYDEKWAEKLLAEEKWIERKNIADKFIDHANKHPKHSGNYYPIVQLCKRLIDDSNMAVQICGIKILKAISRGLRKELTRDGRKVVNLLLPRLKERKRQFTDEIVECLKATLYYISPQDVKEEYEEQLNSKNTVLKVNVLQWLIAAVDSEPEAKVEGLLSAFKPCITRLLEDSAKEVRDANIGLISSLQAKLGNNNEKMKDLIDKLPKNQATKLSGGMNDAAIRGKSLNKLSGVSRNSSKSPTPISMAQRPGAINKKMDLETVKGGKRETAAGSSFSEVRLDISLEESIKTLSGKGVSMEEFQTAQAGQWKAKSEYLKQLQSKLTDASEEELNSFAVLLTSTLKAFKEANPLLLKDYMTIVHETITSNKGRIGPKFVYSFSHFLAEKYGDIKLIEKQKEIIKSLPANLLPKFILSICEVISSKNPSAKTQVGLLKLLTEMLENDSSIVPRRELTAVAKESCSSNNTGVKDEACNLFCSLYTNFGDQIKKSIVDLNPLLKKSIEAKFEKIQPKQAEPDENMPRRDVSQSISKISGQLRDQKWTVRRDAIIEAAKIISGAVKITTKGLNDFGNIVKERLADANQMVSKEALNLMKFYVTALGIDFRGQAKTLVPLVIPFLNDKIEATRVVAKEVLKRSEEAAGSEFILPITIKAMGEPNPDISLKVMDYLNCERVIKELRKVDSKIFAKYLVNNLIHKNSSIRSVSEKLFEKTCNVISREVWLDSVRDFNPTIKNAAESMILKYLPVVGSLKGANSTNAQANGNTNQKMDIEQIREKSIEKVTQRVLNPASKDWSKTPSENGKSAGNSHQKSSSGAKVVNSETDLPDVTITYTEPKDEEISSIREKLILAFGDVSAEKMMSLEQARVIDSLSSLGLIRLTNPDRYKRLLCLIFNWMYLRVFETSRKNILDLLCEFLLNNLEDFALRNYQIGSNVYSRMMQVFARITMAHPNKDEMLGFIHKFTATLGKCEWKDEFFGYLIECLGSNIDPQLIGLILTQMLDYVDLKKAISIKNVQSLEYFLSTISNLTEQEIYHFFMKSMTLLGQSFTTVFPFANSGILSKHFAIRNPQTEIPAISQVSIILRNLQMGSIHDMVNSMKTMTSLIMEGCESTITEISNNGSHIGLVLTKLNNILVNNTSNHEFCEAYFTMQEKLFQLKKFTSSLGPSTLFEVLDSMLDTLLFYYRKSKADPECISLKRIIQSINNNVLALISLTPQDIAYETLQEMLINNHRLTVHDEIHSDKYRTKNTVVINCLLSITKKLCSDTHVHHANVTGILAKMHVFLKEFGDNEMTQSHKCIRTMVRELCKILGQDIWQYYTVSASENGQRTLANWIRSYLPKDSPHVKNDTVVVSSKKPSPSVEVVGPDSSHVVSLIMPRLIAASESDIQGILDTEKRRLAAEDIKQILDKLNLLAPEKAEIANSWLQSEKENTTSNSGEKFLQKLPQTEPFSKSQKSIELENPSASSGHYQPFSSSTINSN